MNIGHKINNMECTFCKSKELTYNQLVMDSYCADCGEWQEDEYIK